MSRRYNAGPRADLGPTHFRSSWEANVARWLNYHGRRWEYEPTTFWFEKIRRGARSYLPDFYLPDEDRYIEVKGWMDAKSATKLRRMKLYHPNVTVEVIDAARYRGLEAFAAVIPAWEKPGDPFVRRAPRRKANAPKRRLFSVSDGRSLFLPPELARALDRAKQVPAMPRRPPWR